MTWLPRSMHISWRSPQGSSRSTAVCEGQPDVVRVIDQTGHDTTACLLPGAVLLASLNGGRVRPAQGGPPRRSWCGGA
jgi:hypothetical protein